MQAARGASLNPSDPSPQPRSRDRRTSRLLFFGIALTLLVVDQGTKHLALKHLAEYETKPLVGDLFGLRLVHNPGAAFSLGTSATEFLTAFACIAAVVVLFLARRLADRTWAVGFGFLLAGICGNLVDRFVRDPGVFRGHVVDFFALPDFPVFNVADVCINIAAAVIIIQAVRGVHLDGSREKPTEPEPTGSTDE